MHPFHTEDLVVCINDTPLPGREPAPGEAWISANHVYRIVRTGLIGEDQHGVTLSGLTVDNPKRWWFAWRFRHVQAADDAFIAMLRALPRHDAPANAGGRRG